MLSRAGAEGLWGERVFACFVVLVWKGAEGLNSGLGCI